MENPRGRSGGLLEALRGDEPAKTRQTLKAMFFGGVVLVAGSYGYLAGVEPDPAAIPDFTIAYLAVGAGVGVALTAGLALQMDEQEDSNDE